ncbi:ribosomal protein S18-alanine N-acetyltransferase [Bacillota bacterium Meth-B3]|nr:ribosomal protein S18-alanine N-acetyltransferase [Christensenellaceae bacterium]MEA5064967.1 ribosomal protein S18-alanine N-acetyltransferase [Eubacteriales bacterium]
MAEITISLMTLEDIDQVHEIECACFSIPWSRQAFATEVRENQCARYLVLKEDGEAVAYAGVWFVLDEAHITNIAVRPDRRGLGYGEAVTRALMQLAADSGMSMLELEVRVSNRAARALYEKLGFVEVGLRKRYYADTGEDALLMACEHLPEAHPEDDPFLVHEE